MKSKEHKIEETTLDQIIAVAYGDADKGTEEKIFKIVRDNQNAKQIYNQYRRTAEAVHKIKLSKAPSSLEDKLFGNSVQQRQRAERRHFAELILHPAMVMVYTAIIFGLIFSSEFNQISPHDSALYSQEEIMKANNEAVASLLLVKDILTSAEHTLKHEILSDIGKPINKGLNTVNFLFERGGKNEK